MSQLPSTPCRLLLSPPADGAWNMAIDELLLEEAAEHGTATWRFYTWSRPTLSLGYFQEGQTRECHPPSRECPMVRRLTGGGAILHDAELTYSVALPGRHPLALRRELLYQAVHRSLLAMLRSLGLSAQLCPGRQASAHGAEPFLCFQRRARGDVLVDETKLAGSAQRRLQGAVLQHGSILWRRSPAAPELPGLEDLLSRMIPMPDFQAAWADRLAADLSLRWSYEPLSEGQCRRASLLAAGRYANTAWTERRYKG